MEKIIEIPASEPNAKGEKVKIKVHLKATANVPRMYRIWFQRDIIKDMQKLKVAAKKAKHKKQEFGVEDLSIFENVAYCMARLGDPENTPKNIMLRAIRQEVPGIYLRTTLMVGFPGETDEEFEELVQFVKEMRFERMGAFAYSEEEGTYAAEHYEDDIEDEVKQNRLDRLMRIQQRIIYH